MGLKQVLISLIKRLPFAITRNQRYDRLTRQIMQRVLSPTSTCIDVGCHKGEVLDIILQLSPKGQHFGFEPIPNMFSALKAKYAGKATILPIALCNEKGTSTFNHVVSNPSYSGLIKRKYDRPNEEDTLITVQTDRLDDVIPSGMEVALIKIDVEGGELGVLQGARETLKRCHPIIIFEHGLGASEFYGSGPEMVHALLTECGLKVSLMDAWLAGGTSLTVAAFKHQFETGTNYYFVAHP